MKSLSSRQHLLQLLQIQVLELHQEFSALTKTAEPVVAEPIAGAEAELPPTAATELIAVAEPVNSQPDTEHPFAKDLLLALSEYQADLEWRLNSASTEPVIQNGLLVTPSIELLQSAQQKKLLWLCLQQKS
jgi:hypothetical protein